MASSDKTRNGSFLSKLLRKLMYFLIFLILVLAVVGWWRNWFALAVSSPEDSEQIDLTISVYKQRISKDAEQVVAEAKQLVRSISGKSELQSVEGTVVSVDATKRQFTMRTGEEGKMTIAWTSDTETASGYLESLQQLARGEQVSVTYRQEQGMKMAHKVVVLEESSSR